MALFGSARVQEAGEHSHQQSEKWARVVATETADAVERPQANTFLARRSGETRQRRTKCRWKRSTWRITQISWNGLVPKAVRGFWQQTLDLHRPSNHRTSQ